MGKKKEKLKEKIKKKTRAQKEKEEYMERYKDTLKAIGLILLILGTVAFTEWVILKDYEPIKAPGWQGERLGE